MVDINSFKITPVQGQVDLSFAGSVVSARVKSTEPTALVAGQAIKLVDTAGGVPEVTALTANTDQAFGFVTRNLKDASFPAYASVEIGLQSTVVWMTAGAAIARGAKLEVVYTTNKVITNAGTNPVCGYAYDKAAADGDLIRVYVITPQFNAAQTIADIAGLQDDLDALALYNQSVVNVVTLAEVNAGKVLVSVPTGKKAIVTDFIARCSGAFAIGTSIDLLVGAANVASIAQAQATNGAILHPGETGVTLGAAFGIAGADGDDVTVGKTGSAFTTATNVTFTVTYRLIDA